MREYLGKFIKMFHSPGIAAVVRWSKPLHLKIVLICVLTSGATVLSLLFTLATRGLVDGAVSSEALDRMKCTRIVIAHRLSTIRHCDRILVMDGGKIAEDGTYDELIEKNGFFADLVARQRIDI